MSFILASRLRRAWPISERVLVFQLVHQVLSANFVSVQGTTTRKRCLTDEQRSDAIAVTPRSTPFLCSSLLDSSVPYFLRYHPYDLLMLPPPRCSRVT